jgi:hypothetical protein
LVQKKNHCKECDCIHAAVDLQIKFIDEVTIGKLRLEFVDVAMNL